MKTLAPRLQARLWLIACAVAGAAMLFLFDDSCQQDGPQHYLFARWAWTHHELFVGVWSRPLYTSVYAFPALIGYRAARSLTVLICLAIAHQTWRLAEDLKIDRAPLAIALVWLQPSFFLFCADNMTEPIFALVYVIAMRLHHRGRLNAGMAVASLMILARPEGFFLGVLWGLWVLAERRKDRETERRGDGATGRRGDGATRRLGGSSPDPPGLPVSPSPRLPVSLFLLATGAFAWWLAALAITGDPLFIKRNWPANWPMTGTIYGAAGLYAYPIRLPEVVGLFLLPIFLYGLWRLLESRQLYTLTSSFLLLFILHTILRAYGLLGSAGYPRYLVTISPAIALITLTGWNDLVKLSLRPRRGSFRTTDNEGQENAEHAGNAEHAEMTEDAEHAENTEDAENRLKSFACSVYSACSAFFSRFKRAKSLRFVVCFLIIAISAFTNFLYADGAEWARDARAIAAVHSWFQARPDKPPVTRLIWSHPYSCVLFDRDPWENPGFTRDREANLKTLRECKAGTLAVWDEQVGPKWSGLRAEDFEEAGFVRLHASSFALKGYVLDRSWFGYGGPRAQTIYLLYKPQPVSIWGLDHRFGH